MLLRGPDFDIVERLSVYDKAQGKPCSIRALSDVACQYLFTSQTCNDNFAGSHLLVYTCAAFLLSPSIVPQLAYYCKKRTNKVDAALKHRLYPVFWA